jgi:hypothetical protein
MFEYIVEKNNKKTLDAAGRGEVVDIISNKFRDWDKLRSEQFRIYEKLKREIYLEDRVDPKKSKWKSQKFFNKIYSLYSTSQAFIWQNLYPSINSMFTVSGLNAKSEENADSQKAYLASALDRMKVSQQLDKGVEYLDSMGEICLFTSMKKKYKQARRPLTLLEDLQKNGLWSLLRKEKSYGIFEKEVYNGAFVKAVNPLNIVFDPSASPEIKDEWDKCGKIIKSWASCDDIASNSFYRLTSEELGEIKNMTFPGNNYDDKTDIKPAEYRTDDAVYNGKAEVLEYYGDFVFNGDALHNFLIVVVGRKYLAKFEENPFLINPIINVALERNPETNRGIPKLWSVYDLAKAQERIMNDLEDIRQLGKNPPLYAPDGFFKNKNLDIEPGLIIEYKPNFEDPNAIKPITVVAPNHEKLISYYDQIISEVSGIYPNMMGENENRNVTATEINTKVSGQTTRLSKDLEVLKQNCILRMVENIAELLANEQNGREDAYGYVKGKKTKFSIDDNVRQGDYEYSYGDSNALLEKKANFKEAMELLKIAAQKPELNNLINWKSVFEKYLDIIGIGTGDEFFLDDEKSQIINFINKIPSPLMPSIIQILQPVLPQIAELAASMQNNNINENNNI